MAAENLDSGTRGYMVQGRAMRRIGDVVRAYERNQPLPAELRGPNRRHPVTVVEGVLLDDLDGTDDPNVPAIAQFQIKGVKADYGWGNLPTPSIITVRNRTKSAWTAGTIGLATELDFTYWVFNPIGISIQHGIVHENLGCGYYTIEKATWSGDPDLAGIGLGSGSGIGDCDPCYDVTGEGTSACAITLTYPPLQVTGTGEYVTAFDEASQIIPLVVGTSCKMVDMGDRIGGSASGSGSDNGEPCWQILRGVMNHTVQYKITDDDCCDASGQTGTYTVLQKTPIILIGKECSPINCGSCDPGSGS